MPYNSLYSFFSNLFAASDQSLGPWSLIRLEDQEYVLNNHLISYHSKSETKEPRLRFAFVGDLAADGLFGSIHHVKARITPKNLSFDTEKCKHSAVKIFKDSSTFFKADRLRDDEFWHASQVKTLHAKKTGPCIDQLPGMIMRYFDGENLGRMVRRESYQLIRTYSPLAYLPIETLSLLFNERNTIIGINHSLYEYQHDDQTITKLVPGVKEEFKASSELLAHLTTMHLDEFADAPMEALKNLALLKQEPVERYEPLPIPVRLRLTLNLLKAYKEQVLDSGLCHHDIKPENIVINKKTETVHFVDFGFSKNLGLEESEYRGTLLYAAPERIDMGINRTTLIVQSASDIFSLGKVIAFLWGIDTEEFGTNVHELININKGALYFKTLFCHLSQAPTIDIQQRIRKMLLSMTHHDPKLRPEISQLISKFEKIEQEHRIQSVIDLGAGMPRPC